MREYSKAVHGEEVPIRLYTIEEYIGELGGTVEGLLYVAKSETAAGEEFSFIGVAVVPGDAPIPEEIGFSTQMAEEVLGLGLDDYALAAEDDSGTGPWIEPDTFLLKRWPRDAPEEITSRLDSKEE